MKEIVNLLFEARILKEIPRSGFQFLGSGRESVAEHSYLTAFIGSVLAYLVPEVDQLRLLQMCLVHDLAEARTGDLNYVQKGYVTADEAKAVDDLTRKVLTQSPRSLMKLCFMMAVRALRMWLRLDRSASAAALTRDRKSVV